MSTSTKPFHLSLSSLQWKEGLSSIFILNKEVVIGVGKFGPYIRHDGKFTSLPKDHKPLEITLEEASELIVAKRNEEQSRILKTFDEEPDLQVINGRYGAYIAYNKSNYKLPKGTVAEELTLEDCKKIIAEQGDKPAKKTTKRGKTSKK